MCTVTIFRGKNEFILTSNRDEHISRVVQTKPLIKSIQNIQVMFPQDPLAGGTWFATNELGGTAVLLNGAFTRHVRLPNYRLSRGVVLLEVLNTSDPLSSLLKIDLENIEPFTMILVVDDTLTEFRWDGLKKHVSSLEKNTPHIFSSATLYDPTQRQHRENLFNQFLKESSVKNAETIFDFHKQTNNDSLNGFVMKRSEVLRTLSITQVITSVTGSKMKHYDVISETYFHAELGRKYQMTIQN
jgi:hypothetical protein